MYWDQEWPYWSLFPPIQTPLGRTHVLFLEVATSPSTCPCLERSQGEISAHFTQGWPCIVWKRCPMQGHTSNPRFYSIPGEARVKPLGFSFSIPISRGKRGLWRRCPSYLCPGHSNRAQKAGLDTIIWRVVHRTATLKKYPLVVMKIYGTPK